MKSLTSVVDQRRGVDDEGEDGGCLPLHRRTLLGDTGEATAIGGGCAIGVAVVAAAASCCW